VCAQAGRFVCALALNSHHTAENQCRQQSNNDARDLLAIVKT
jgi:hypothetical protein